jgi:hypothetical protein
MTKFMVQDIPLVRADGLIKVEMNTTTYYQAIMKAWDDDYIEKHSREFARQFKAKQLGMESVYGYGRKISNADVYSFEGYRDYFKRNYGKDTGIFLRAPKGDTYEDGDQYYELTFYEPDATQEIYKWDSEYNRAELPGAVYLAREYEQLLYPYFAKSIIEQQKIKLRGGLHSELKKRYSKRENIHSNHIKRGVTNG